MAAVTKNLVFGVTASTTYDNPYALARRFSTVDHLSDGRVAWNIVTSYLDSAARNFGLDTQIEHDERYKIAEEYMEVVYKVSPLLSRLHIAILMRPALGKQLARRRRAPRLHVRPVRDSRPRARDQSQRPILQRPWPSPLRTLAATHALPVPSRHLESRDGVRGEAR